MAKRRPANRRPTGQASPEPLSKSTEDLLRETSEALAKLQASKPKSLWPKLVNYVFIGLGLWWFGSSWKPSPDAGPNPGPTVPLIAALTSEEIAQAKQAIPEQADRLSLSVAFDILAQLVSQDAKNDPPAIKDREQISERLLAETLRAYVLSGGKLESQQAASFLASFFDSQEEFPQQAGPLSGPERELGIRQFRRIAAVCKAAK